MFLDWIIRLTILKMGIDGYFRFFEGCFLLVA